MTAKSKQSARKRQAKGIAVGNRFRVDAYFETQEQIASIDKCAKTHRESRSRYVSNAALERVERDLARMSTGKAGCAQ